MPKDLKKSVSQANVISLLLQNADYKSVEKELTAVSGIESIARIEESEHQLQIQLSCQTSADLRPEIYRRIKQTEWIVLDFHQETQTLEAIFRELTKEN